MIQATDEHLRRLPKVELHCHVEGAARASTIADLARQHDVTLPVEDPAELFEFTSLNQFLSIYDIICASLRTADDFRRITYEALEDGAAAGRALPRDVLLARIRHPPRRAGRDGVGGRPGRRARRPPRPRHQLPHDPRLRQAHRAGPRAWRWRSSPGRWTTATC